MNEQDSPPVTAEEDEAAKAAQETAAAPVLVPLPEVDQATAEYIEKRLALFRAELVVCGQIPPAPSA